MQLSKIGATDATTSSTPKALDDPKKLGDAAQQFEALLIGQILKDVSASAGSGGLGDPDAASGSMLDMANESFARAIASRGGLGLAAMVVRDVGVRPPTASMNAGEK